MTNRILIVDDQPSARETLLSILEPDGYEIRLAENGKKALEEVEEFEPDVILLDVMMPGMDGYEVCERIRGNPKTAEIPILFLTAPENKKDYLRGLNVGADAATKTHPDRTRIDQKSPSIRSGIFLGQMKLAS